MKNMAPEVIRLMTAAAETRDSLRSLAVQIDAARQDPKRQTEMIGKARAVSATCSDLLRRALKDCSARRRSYAVPDSPPLWAVSREFR